MSPTPSEDLISTDDSKARSSKVTTETNEASSLQRDLISTPLQFFPGIGPHRAVLLERLGIHRPVELLFLFPRSYQDVALLKTVDQLESDIRTSVVGTIESLDLRSFSDGGSVLGVLLKAEGGYVRLVWYNQAFRQHQLGRGMQLVASGIPKPTGISWEMRHPEIQILEPGQSPLAGKPLAIYPLTEGLQQRHLRQMVAGVVELLIDSVQEVLPEDFRQVNHLLPIRDALRSIHEPDSLGHADAARRRFIFQELFVFQLALAMRRRGLRLARPAPALEPTGKIHARILRRFPFELSGDQLQAIREVGQDMGCDQPMNRLLQGDVGSGKTVVAQYAMLLAVAHHYQAALMVPTEVLARQHAKRLAASLIQSDVQVELLVGSLAQRERNELLERIALGTVDLVVGTQALLSEHVQFANLGLVVIDEQHKFGVAQRASLRSSRIQPHYLVLSATPIPRTITMTAFGDLDVSILREKPPGPAAVHTYLGQSEQQSSWWAFVAKQVSEGRQAFVITPRLSIAEDEEIASAEQTYQRLHDGLLREFSIGLLHGRMEGPDKQRVLDQFTSGEIQVLVATTVVEVGIDVANATVMTILDADRLGLSQLHQLRGRIGRGTQPGYVCAFASQGASPDDNARLAAFLANDDGFKLAELDLQLRGPGDLLGTRQSGLPPLRIADLVRDSELVLEARTAARQVIDADALLADPKWSRLRSQVLRRHGDMLDFGDVG